MYCRTLTLSPPASCTTVTRGTWGKSKGRTANGEVVAKAQTRNSENVDTTSRTGWAMKLWRRGSSQERPLRPASSYSSENSYTEEPYVHPDAQSAVYAELAQGLNTYSEIPDPGGLLNQQRINTSDFGYENAGYALSEAHSDLGEIVMPHSSAYYSDVPQETHQKNSNNRKTNTACEVAQFSNVSGRMLPPSISSTIPMMPTSVSGTNCLSQEMLPLSLRLLPNSIALQRQVNTYSCSSCHACASVNTLPNLRHSCGVPSQIVLGSTTSNAIPLMSLNRSQIPELGSVNRMQLTAMPLSAHQANVINGQSNPRIHLYRGRSATANSDDAGASSEYV